jgi:hypothetical protein
MIGIGFAPRRSVLAEDIRDLQRWTRHDSRGLGWRLSPHSNLGLLPSLGLLRWFGSALRLRLLPRFGLLRQVSVTPLYNGGVPRMLAFVRAPTLIFSLHPLWSFDNILLESMREGWIRTNNIRPRVVANRMPGLQRDLGDSK